MRAETGQRVREEDCEGRQKTGGFPVSKAGTQFSFPFDIDVSTLGHMLGTAWGPEYPTEGSELSL